MVIDIKMCRFDNVPWGFRLVGGADFEYPLTVVKVNEGSIAEEAGLMVDDVIVRINDTPTSPLTHDETNKMIKHCGNVFYFGVYRDEPEPTPTHFPIIGYERSVSPQSILEANNNNVEEHQATIVEEHQSTIVEEHQLENVEDLEEERPCSAISENTEIKLVEEEIAAVLSGETEVLKEHNVLGIFPKPGVCMTSDVLRRLNEEAIMTKAEKDKENKKWSTFLQKPDRPIPLSKAQIEAERRAANAYKVKIVKSAPRTPERAVSPAVQTPIAKEPTPPLVVDEPELLSEPEPEIDEAPPTDSEVPNLEEQTAEDENNMQIEEPSDNEEKSDKEKEATPENKEIEEAEQMQIAAADQCKQEYEENAKTSTKTEEELALERQLADVQRQLVALSNLPSTIQDTLDAVTKQLADILPAFKLQQPQEPKISKQNIENETRAISLERIEETQTEITNEDVTEEENVEEEIKEEVDNNDKTENKENEIEIKTIDDNKTKINVNGDLNEKYRTNEKSSNMESAYNEDKENLKKQKRHDVIDELEEHLERKQQNAATQRRSKRAFGPLTPSSERPLVLPGGRRWYRPKDAYNDEFIAETLSAQAELITGTTLGCTFESPLLGYDSRALHSACVTQQLLHNKNRVNFMKYQKPEKKIDLNRSEVYKVIHHLDRQPVRGIEVRPPVVLAEADVKKAARI